MRSGGHDADFGASVDEELALGDSVVEVEELV